MSQYFPKPYESFGGDINVKLDLSNYATKTELKAKQDKIINLKTFNLSYFKGKKPFEKNGTQNYLVFQPRYRYFKKIGNTDNVLGWII